MPPYTTREKVRGALTRVPEPPDGPDAGTAASLSNERIDAAIESAGHLIDAKLAVFYAVPFETTPALVTVIATALAAYDCDQTFREVRDYASELNPVYLRYREAQELLTQLQTGKAVLPDYEPPDPDPGPTDPAGGDIVDVINPNLCEFQRPQPSWMDTYYGWTL